MEAYDRARPSYPREALTSVARELRLGSHAAVLDLGAGTGKLTQLLLPLARRVVAVEPSEPMLAKLCERLPGVDARPGVAEAIPLPDTTVDAVFVGEAFHWFSAPAACREIARVLVDGGGLVLLWNRARWNEDDVPWLSDFNRLVEPHRVAAGPFPAGETQWRSALKSSGAFGDLSGAEFEHVHRLDAERFVDLVRSWSWISNLPTECRSSVLAEVAALLAPSPEIVLRYATEVWWACRT